MKAAIHAVLIQERRQTASGGVIPGKPQQRDPKPQRRHVSGHIGRAARPLLGATDPHHGHRRLR